MNANKLMKESTNKTISLPVVTEAPALTVADCVLSIFKADPVREFKTDEIVLDVQKNFPAHGKKDSILTHIAALKKNGVIMKVRQEGTTHILRLASAAAPAVPAPALSTPPTESVIDAEKASPATDLGDALVNLSNLLVKQERLNQEISLMKSLVRRMVNE